MKINHSRKSKIWGFLEDIRKEGMYPESTIDKLEAYISEDPKDVVNLIFHNEPIPVCRAMMDILLRFGNHEF